MSGDQKDFFPQTFLSSDLFCFWSFIFVHVCFSPSLVSWPSLFIFLVRSQAAGVHQLLNAPAPYHHPPLCTFVVRVVPCLPSNTLLSTQDTRFLVGNWPLELRFLTSGSVFLAGFLSAGPPRSPLMPELQLR